MPPRRPMNVAYLVQKALKEGKLKRPRVCSQCHKEGFIEGHHEDYSRPLEVVWLCRACHRQLHGTRKKAGLPPLMPKNDAMRISLDISDAIGDQLRALQRLLARPNTRRLSQRDVLQVLVVEAYNRLIEETPDGSESDTPPARQGDHRHR